MFTLLRFGIIILLIILFYLDTKRSFKNNATREQIVKFSQTTDSASRNLLDSLSLLKDMANAESIRNLNYIRSLSTVDVDLIPMKKDVKIDQLNDLSCGDLISFDIKKKDKIEHFASERFFDFKDLVDKYPNLDLALNLVHNSEFNDFLAKRPDGIFADYAIKLDKAQKVPIVQPDVVSKVLKFQKKRIKCSSVVKCSYRILSSNWKVLHSGEVKFSIFSNSTPVWIMNNLIHGGEGSYLLFAVDPSDGDYVEKIESLLSLTELRSKKQKDVIFFELKVESVF